MWGAYSLRIQLAPCRPPNPHECLGLDLLKRGVEPQTLQGKAEVGGRLGAPLHVRVSGASQDNNTTVKDEQRAECCRRKLRSTV